MRKKSKKEETVSLALFSFFLLPFSFLAAGCQQQPDPAAAELPEVSELVILTPHSREIRDAFGRHFGLWHEDRYGKPVSIRWIDKGTVDAQRYIYDRFQQYPETGPGHIGVDVFFGGGLAVHQDVADRGYSQAVKVPDRVLEKIPPQLNGQPLYDPEGRWYGTALSGFGILYNKKACALRGLPEPVTWKDLTHPVWRGWVAAADPSLSGSTAECLILVLLRYGWEEGWGTMNGILANCSGLSPSSAHIAPNVAAGIAVAGLQAEFVARMAIAAASDNLEYASPPAATAILPDPASVISGARNHEVARNFVEFLLSTEGQLLWALPSDDYASSEAFYRYPIRPDIYEQYGDRLIIRGNPFSDHMDFPIDVAAEAAYTRLLPFVLRAAAGENHLLMQKAWAAAWSQGEQSSALALLRTPPFSYEQAMLLAAELADDPLRAAELEAQWSDLFRERYEAVLATAMPVN